jgi:hypothetical protein
MAHAATIDRLKAIANRSADALLLADGPPHPDWKLLDLAAEVLSLTRAAKLEAAEYHQLSHSHPGRPVTAIERQRLKVLMEQWQSTEKKIKPLLTRARKLPATTPAGVYAKVLIVRSSRTGASYLAMNLAEELVRCEGLRQSLWPADQGALP